MLLTRKLAGSFKYIVFGAFFYNCERKKNNVPKGGTIVFKKNVPPTNYKFQIHNIAHARLLEAPVHKVTQCKYAVF